METEKRYYLHSKAGGNDRTGFVLTDNSTDARLEELKAIAAAFYKTLRGE